MLQAFPFLTSLTQPSKPLYLLICWITSILTGSEAGLAGTSRNTLPVAGTHPRAAAPDGAMLRLRREIWYHFTSPGTFHALLNALAGLFSGQGWHFVPPQRPHKLRKLKHKKSGEGRHEKGSPDAFNWCLLLPFADASLACQT